MRLVRLLAFAIASIVLGVVAAARADRSDQTNRISNTVHFTPGKTLRIRLDTGAGLRITGWDRSEVSAESDWREGKCRDAQVNLTTSDDGALLESHYADGSGSNHSCSMNLEVHVPSHCDVRISSAGGGIAISEVTGDFSGHSGGGGLDLLHVHGRADLTTGGGEIEVRDSELDGRVSTGGGHINFVGVHGGIEGHSGSVRSVRTSRGRGRVQEF